MKTQIFYGGWILTVLATFVVICVNKEANIWPGTVFCVGLFALSTYCLLRNVDFPHREIGLAISWIGPLLLAVGNIVYLCYLNPAFQYFANVTLPTSATNAAMQKLLLWMLFFNGCVETAFMAWVTLGYGEISLIALFATIFPKSSQKRTSTWNDIHNFKPYKNRWLWGFLIIYFLLKMFIVVSTGWMFWQSDQDMQQDMQRIEQDIQQNRILHHHPK